MKMLQRQLAAAAADLRFRAAAVGTPTVPRNAAAAGRYR